MTAHLHRVDGDGPPRHRLRSDDFVTPTRAVFMDRESFGDLHATCAAIQLALPPDAVFTHLTSAALRGWRMPVVPVIPIIAATSGEAPHHDRRGVYVRRTDVPPGDRHLFDGVRVASPEWTIVELAEDLSLIDLVAVIDGVLHVGGTTIGRLFDSIVPGRRGAKTLRDSLALVDDRSDSWWESVLRLIHQLAGIPIDSQVEVFDARGAFVARTDLHIVGTVRHPEYDGAEHRLAQRHRKDLRRDKSLSRLGRERFGYTSHEIVNTPTLVVRDAEDALGWVHDPRRCKRWLEELDKSSISRTGWIRLQRRLRRFDRQLSPRSRRAAHRGQ